jgi:hypothetical protein
MAEEVHCRYLGEAVDDCHRLPRAKAVSTCKIIGKALSPMNATSDEDCVNAHPGRTQHVCLQPITNGKHLCPRNVSGRK